MIQDASNRRRSMAFGGMGGALCLAVFLAPVRVPGGTDGVSGQVTVVNAPLHLDASLPAPVVYWEEVRQEPRPLHLHFLLADLADPDIEAAVEVTADPDGEGPATATLRQPLEIARERGFFAAVNANAFMHLLDATEDERKKGWYDGKPVRLFGLAVEDGLPRNPHDERRIPLWFDAKGRARVGSPDAEETPRQAAADWEGPILRDGTVVADESPALHPRTLAGTNSEGSRLLLVVAEGRQTGYSEGLTMREAGALMRERGCDDAVNFDGGGSATMLIATNGILGAVGNPPGRWLRPLPVMLGIRRGIRRKLSP